MGKQTNKIFKPTTLKIRTKRQPTAKSWEDFSLTVGLWEGLD